MIHCQLVTRFGGDLGAIEAVCRPPIVGDGHSCLPAQSSVPGLMALGHREEAEKSTEEAPTRLTRWGGVEYHEVPDGIPLVFVRALAARHVPVKDPCNAGGGRP